MRRAWRRVNYSGLAAVVLCLLVWELGARAHPAFQAYFPPASRVLGAVVELVISGEIVGDTVRTLSRYARGYALAAVVAVAVGVVLGASPFAYSLFDVLIEFLRPMPSVATIPVAILFLGVGDSMKVAVAAYGTAWPILLNTVDGVRSIDRTLIDTGRTLGLSRTQILTKIALPAALPYVVTGLRISLPIALIAVTASEMIAGGNGLGFFILDEQRAFKVENMYAGIVLVSLLGYLLNRGFRLLETRGLVWHTDSRAREAV